MEQQNHYFDEQGVYTGSLPVGREEFPPRNALRCNLPQKEGYWPVVNAAHDGFVLVEDHRGQEGWVNGEQTRITEVGPLPEGWSDTPPMPPDNRMPEEKRRAAYFREADAIRNEALSYQAEADAWRLAGNEARASAAETKAAASLAEYLAKKEEIRERYPDPSYTLAASGVYHAAGCSYAASDGEKLTLEQIAARNASAKPCARCKPPALPVPAEVVPAPDPESDPTPQTVSESASDRYYLTDTNVYHAAGCDGVNEPGAWKEWGDICRNHPEATPCKRCLNV